MRIGIEAQRMFRKDKHGMDVFAVELIRNLQRVDQVNEYVIFARPGEDSQCIQETPNVRIRTFEAATYADWEQIMLPRAVKQEQVDILHCTANTAPLSIDVPLLLTMHDLFFMHSSGRRAFSNPYQYFGNLYRRMIASRALNAATAVSTVSEFSRKSIAASFPEVSAKSNVVYHGVNRLFRYSPRRQEMMSVRVKYAIPDKYLFCLGNTDPRKNSRGILEGYILYRSRNGSASLPLVMTSLTDKQVSSILADLGASEIAPFIITPGYIDAADLPALYSMSTAFVFTSLEEGFGMPIVEAMASFTPVITSNTSACLEIAGDAAVTIDPRNPVELAEALNLVCNQPAFATRLVSLGSARSRRFTWETSARQYLSTYYKVHRAVTQRHSIQTPPLHAIEAAA